MKEYGTVSGKVIDPRDYYKSIAPQEKDPADRVYEGIEHEEEPYNALAYARDTVNDAIAGSDYFVSQALEHGIDRSDTQNLEYLKLLSSITNEYLDQDENRDFFMAIDGGETYHAIRMLGTAPYALKQQIALDHAKNQPNNHGTEHAKATVIAFNHTISQLVEQNPSVSMSKLASEIELTVAQYDHTDKGYAHNAIREILTGVRTEEAFRQAVSMRYDVRHGDASEDRRGVDFVVTLEDNLELGIDVKSSMTGVTEKIGDGAHNGQPFAKTDENKFVYYLATHEENFVHDSFKLDHGARIRMKNTVLEHLQKMRNL